MCQLHGKNRLNSGSRTKNYITKKNNNSTTVGFIYRLIRENFKLLKNSGKLCF